MPELSRSQVIVYGAIAIAVLLLGARWLRGGTDDGRDLALASSGAPRGSGELGAASGGSGGETDEGGETSAEGFAFEPGGGDVIVHVAGEVRRPGVYRLPEGARVTDALKRAGGPTAAAAADAINLAARLGDGQQVVVPARAPQAGRLGAGAGGATGVAAAGGGAAAGAGGEAGPISLGAATAAELETIDGIGPVTAEKIIEYRDSNGGIASIEELDEISGIGPATMETLRESLQP